MSTEFRINAFDAICVLASENNWCWKIPCGTCANYDFRYAFLQLADDRHPDNGNWLLTSYIKKHNIYQFPYRYTDETKEAVLDICLESNLSYIHKNAKFPDWLGYLGVVMEHLGTRYGGNKDLTYQLSKYWANQLQELVPESSKASTHLKYFEDYNCYLDFSILEACEKAISGQEYRDECKEREEKLLYKKHQESLAYENLVSITENTGKPYSVDVAIYTRQEDIDRLTVAQYEILCKMYAHLSIEANTPWANFKAKFLTGRL